MATDIVIRTGLDRLRYAVIFEGLLVAIFSVAMFLMFERGLLDMGAFSVTLSLIALVINFAYNSIYDRIDVRYGRVPTERSRIGRIMHAVGFEFTLVVVNLPVIMWWMQWSFWRALGFDIIAMAAVVVYTYYFTLAYDRIFPIEQPGNGSHRHPV